jgi:diphosphomevalonate decarboxylase
MIRALSTPNIALIKYWGNRNDALRLPAADSLSITLGRPSVEVVVDKAETFAVKSFNVDGSEKMLSNKDIVRLKKHFVLVREYLQSIGARGFPAAVSIEIRSQIPPSVGVASSAAVFSALGEAYAGFVSGISRRDVSVLARLGSGSASRSVYGGFVAMVAGHGDDMGTSYAEQIADEDHWQLHDVIIVPSHDEKKIGSTEGHALAQTSPLFEKRLREIPRRQRECIAAILNKDFEKLRLVSEEDCMDMHAVMQSSMPPLHYLSDETHRLVSAIKRLREQQRINVLYTMDAGPTVHLICDDAGLPLVRAFAAEQKGCTVFEAGVGSGSRLL